ncbi:hypothetical protein EVAR_80062_1 [Eumeta japonica]|uniref:Uncharacterized protein n=1 Tax=Eumeta variegata TaxID=151549 RepID=A0A4C1UCX9_EUMVA|nr:hypothetical protein EVAR_80062_1 [Eumeta japonica]
MNRGYLLIFVEPSRRRYSVVGGGRCARDRGPVTAGAFVQNETLKRARHEFNCDVIKEISATNSLACCIYVYFRFATEKCSRSENSATVDCPAAVNLPTNFKFI